MANSSVTLNLDNVSAVMDPCVSKLEGVSVDLADCQAELKKYQKDTDSWKEFATNLIHSSNSMVKKCESDISDQEKRIEETEQGLEVVNERCSQINEKLESIWFELSDRQTSFDCLESRVGLLEEYYNDNKKLFAILLLQSLIILILLIVIVI